MDYLYHYDICLWNDNKYIIKYFIDNTQLPSQTVTNKEVRRNQWGITAWLHRKLIL